MFELYASRNYLTVRQSETVTSGSVNTVECRFTFSPHWEGLEKTAVFRAGERTAAVLLDESGRCTVPWEVLEKPGRTLSAGVYGRDPEGGLTLPTVWADLRTILEGASPGEMARPPTPDLWEQELAKKGDSLSYDGLNLTLLSGERPLSSVPVAGGGGAVVYHFGHGLRQDGLHVWVDAVDDFHWDNTLPMTAAGVYAAVGNIEALLGAI